MTNRTKLTPETQIELLLTIAQRVKGTLDLDEILRHLLDAILPAVSYDAAGIFILKRGGISPRSSPREHVIAGVAQVGYPITPEEHDPMLREGKGIVGHVIRTGEVAVVSDVTLDPRYIKGRDGTRSEVAVPIFSDREPVGALNLESDTLSAFDEGDVEVLRFFADAAAIGIEQAILHRQIVEKMRLEEQLHLAHEVQAQLLPASPPLVPGYSIAGLYLPSLEIGGDYYDFLNLPQGKTGLVIADVSGKGIPAALIMAAFRTLVRTLGRQDPGPSALAGVLNQTLMEYKATTAFVTSVYGILDPSSGVVDFTNCGHNPPLHVRAGGSTMTISRWSCSRGRGETVL